MSESRASGCRSKACVLREYRQLRGKPCVPEHLLLRDALYLLQGISGRYIQFSQSEEDNSVIFVEEPDCCIPSPTKALIHRLAEVGYLYARVELYVSERENTVGVGMIEQSLCHHLQAQLTEYYRLIAVLESQMALQSVGSKPEDIGIPSSSPDVEVRTGLTLRRLDVWFNEWRLRMRMMSVCVEGARDAHGGALVNLIHSYTDNGDPFVRKFTDQLLEEVSKPFFATLHKWLFSGELYDPFGEFFVAADPAMTHINYVYPYPLANGANQQAGDGGFNGLAVDTDDITGQEDGLKLWEKKYQFQKDMLPTFVGETFGHKIFATGKSLNFIRYSCHDSDWVVTQEKMNTTGGTLRYSDIAGLERSIDIAYQIASYRLFEVFLDKFKLLDHLTALKNYMMLGHGDFVDQLMDALGPSLSKPANALFRHNLTTTLESAIRSSNAQNDPADVLRRLDARMLEYSHGEIGWDIFTLEYKVDPPIDTVLNSASMEKYLKIFKHLWQLKRIECVLNKSWLRMAIGSRTFLPTYWFQEFGLELHKVRLVIAEMIHFVRQMQAYCHLEVIECSWKTLTDFLMKKEGGLDALIEAHRTYLNKLEKKILLLSPKAGKEENILNHVKEVFSVILQYLDATDNFYNHCLSECSRRDQQMDMTRGVYTKVNVTTDNLSGFTGRLREYSSLFTEKTQSIVAHLLAHPDLDCRFLGIRLSFTDFYKVKKDPNK
ncbi:hypothetical protein AMATHDRAFT_139134 [Amanita thiersii Skay4041]|uniref:Uncharacterized protein n=1 Tax=Amanita thiersii Skay4041 TaxID=703135 RepID=A0A2A9NP56_9AGAR|nr:hypothetical protein AMATHDRAFT_139134 [Amanita thiersii Skay4041]